MKIVGLSTISDTPLEVTEEYLWTATRNGLVAGIWNTATDTIFVSVDEDLNGYERSVGSSCTHYRMRSLNVFVANEIDSDKDFEQDDYLTGCIDFDICLRDGQMVANLPHRIASLIPGVVGVEMAETKRNWAELFSRPLCELEHYTEVPVRNFIRWRIESSLEKIAAASGENKWGFIDSFFRSIDETEKLEVAIVAVPATNSFGQPTERWTIALSHFDAGFTGEEVCKNGKISVEFNRSPYLKLSVE